MSFTRERDHGRSPGREIRVLHVDDDPDVAELAAEFLERRDERITVETASSARDGLDRLADDIDCIVSDYDMQGTDGIEFLESVRQTHADLPFILFTGKGSEEVASEAIALGATDYLQKRTGTDQYTLLANRITNAVEQYRIRRERERTIERVTDAVMQVDADWQVTFLDEQTERLYDVEESEVLGRRLWDLFPELRGTRIEDVYRDAMETREPAAVDARSAVLDRWFHVEVYPNDDGGLSVYLDDITERKEREREVRERTEQLQTIFDNANVGIFLYEVVDSETFRVVRANTVIKEYFGLDGETLRGKRPHEIFDEDTAATFAENLRTCLQRGETIVYEESLQLPSGETLFQTELGPVRTDGSVTHIVGVARDITDRRERERDLEILRQAVDNAHVPLVLSDPSQEDNPLVYVNDAFEEVTGYSREDALGRNCRFLQGEETDPERVARLREAVNSEQQLTVELRNYRKDGTEFWNRCTVRPIYGEDGDLLRYLGTQEDVTERKERERDLARYERLVETVGDGIYVLDGDFEFVMVNDAMTDLTGYSREDLLGMELDEVVATAATPIGADAREKLRDSDRDARTVRAQIRTAGGECRPCEFRFTFLDAGADGQTVGVVRDVTGRKERETRLERQNDRLAALFENFPEPTFAYVYEDGEPRVASVNEAFTEVFGYDAEEAVGEGVDDLIVPPDRREEARRLDERVRAGESMDEVLRRQTSDGLRDFWFRNVRLPGDDEIDGYAIYADVTERRQRERELEQYRTLVETVGDPMYMLDAEGTITMVNEAVVEQWGYPREDLVGMHASDLLPEGEYERGTELIRELLADEERSWGSYEMRSVTADGTTLVNENKIGVITDDGEYLGSVGVIRDITERKEHERELRRKNERLEEFTSIVSHDLRNPLQVAEGRLELAREECESDHLGDVADALDRSQALIDDLLALAREGETVSDLTAVDLADAAERCCGTVVTDGATLVADTGQVVRADEGRLRQLLENLIRNAVEHGGGDVTITVGALEDGFYVADDGPGIPEGERETVFEPGYSTAAEGTGFGLRIVERIAEAHGWEVGVTDSEDGGARFEITGVETVT